MKPDKNLKNEKLLKDLSFDDWSIKSFDRLVVD